MPSWCYPPAERLVGQAVLFGDGGGVGEPVRGSSGDLVCTHGRILQDDGAYQADGGGPQRRQLVNERDAYAQQAQLDDPLQYPRAENHGILQRGGREDLIHDDDAASRGSVQDLVNPGQVVLQLSPEILQVLACLKVREHPVEQEQLRLAARYWAADAGQVVQLAERPGKGRLAALVGTRDHKDPLRVLEVEIVAHHWPLLRDQLAGQGQVK